jgi:hypothetical protein
MTDLEKAAKAWDAAEREGQLHPEPPPPDTRPRNALTNRPVTFSANARWSTGDGEWHDVQRDYRSFNPWR